MRVERVTVGVVAGMTTAAAASLVLVGAGPVGLLLGIVAAGMPATVLLLGLAVMGEAADVRPAWPSLLIGAVLLPILVLALPTFVAMATYLLVEPLRAAGTELLDTLRVSPTLVAFLRSPWAVVSFVGFALVVPMVAEAAKPLGSVLRRPDSRSEAYLFGMAAGAGFAVAESLLFALGGWLSHDGWRLLVVLVASGAAVHLLGAGSVSVAMYDVHTRRAGRLTAVKAYTIAVAVHAVRNAAIVATVVLVNERSIVLGGVAGGAQVPGVTLEVLLGTLGLMALVLLLLGARRAAGGWPLLEPLQRFSLGRPQGMAAWALFAVVLLIPAGVLVVVFPAFLLL